MTENYKVIHINGAKLTVYADGYIYRDNRTKDVDGLPILSPGRDIKNIKLNAKPYLCNRLMAAAFLDLDINDSTKAVIYIDGNKFNNRVNNLKIIDSIKIGCKKTNVKGYQLRKDTGKYEARITVNGTTNRLGCFTTEEEARKAYLDAKLMYHVI